MTEHEKRTLKILLEDGFEYITKVDGENNKFYVEDKARKQKLAAYFNMQGTPIVGLKPYMFKQLRKNKEYSIKELLND